MDAQAPHCGASSSALCRWPSCRSPVTGPKSAPDSWRGCHSPPAHPAHPDIAPRLPFSKHELHDASLCLRSFPVDAVLCCTTCCVDLLVGALLRPVAVSPALPSSAGGDLNRACQKEDQRAAPVIKDSSRSLLVCIRTAKCAHRQFDLVSPTIDLVKLDGIMKSNIFVALATGSSAGSNRFRNSLYS